MGISKRRKPRRIKRSYLQNLRYALLISVLLFFVLVPVSNWYANNKLSFNHPHLVGLASGPFAQWTYRALDVFYGFWDDPITAATSSNGSLWAFTVFGLPMSDPLGLISELINSVKFPVKYVVGGILPFAIAFLLGRVFCSWICPMELLYGITARIRSMMLKLKIPLMSLKLEPGTRAFVFWGGLVLSNIFGAWVWHFVLPYISFTHEIFSIIVFSSFTVGVYFLIALLVLDIGLIPGEFCRSVCPTGYLLSSIGRVSVFRLKADSKNCPKSCTLCQTVCPIDLFPRVGNLHSCHLCMKCVDNCPKGHIELKVNPIYRNFPSKEVSS